MGPPSGRGRIPVRSDTVEGQLGATRSEFLPFYAPSIGDEEIREVTAALRSDWLTSGPRVQQFEEEFAAVVGAPAAAAVSSCTAALHVSLAALGIGPGDAVVTT